MDDSVRARPVLHASAVTFSDPPPAYLSIPESSSRVAFLSALPPITILEECGSDASRIHASRRDSALAEPSVPSRAAIISTSECQTRTHALHEDLSAADTHVPTSWMASHGTSFVVPQPTLQPSTQDLGETMLRSHIAVLEKEVARLRDQQSPCDYLEDVPPPLYREVVRSG